MFFIFLCLLAPKFHVAKAKPCKLVLLGYQSLNVTLVHTEFKTEASDAVLFFEKKTGAQIIMENIDEKEVSTDNKNLINKSYLISFFLKSIDIHQRLSNASLANISPPPKIIG